MPETKYKVKTKPKKGAPLSAAQKQAVASGTYERKVEPAGKKVAKFINRNFDAHIGESKYGRSATPLKTNLKSRFGSNYCPTGTKSCKTAYSKSSKKTK
jgi:hypothetical protein